MESEISYQEETSKNQSIQDAEPVPSFFKNSSKGQAIEMSTEDVNDALPGEAVNGPSQAEANQMGVVNPKQRGGYTCCVPLCYNNSKRENHLKFYRFPNGSSQEKKVLRNKWIHMIDRKNFVPNENHRVCSAHFRGGEKTYLENVRLIVPIATRPTIPTPRTTVRSRNRPAVDTLLQQQKPPKRVRVNTSAADLLLMPTDEVSALKEEIRAIKASYEETISKLNLEAESKNLEIENLMARMAKTDLSVENMKNDSTKMFHFYTGLEDYTTFTILFDSFGSITNNLIYYDSNTNAAKLDENRNKRGPKRSLHPEQELFLVLVRLRCGLLEKDLAYRADISVSHFSRIFITWIDFLHTRFRAFPIWPSKETVLETMPPCFLDTYPSTRVIIDATEIFMEMPSSLRSQSETYSSYKHHNTAKGLIGIAPCGAISFVSNLYAGRCSDKAITKDSGIYDLLEPGDAVMADKGFTIEDDLPEGTALNIPPFLRDNANLTLAEETETRRIAAVRVHVERAIRRIKTFRILKTVFPISMSADLNKIWIVCAYLTNLLPPLIALKG